ncbi:MAG: hypothetical protein AAF696_34020 [Bacteroidota bacterium]
MQKQILIANLGNRNILYKGEYHFGLAKEGKTDFSFRSYTQDLWENFETKKSDISLNILDSFLSEKADEIDGLVLFASDQPKSLRRDQDTIFVGKIIEKLIPEQYPNLAIQVRSLNIPITNNDALLRAYRGHIQQLKAQFPESKFLICDAGGTAQQKSALKIMCEYLLDREDLEVYYVAQGKDYQSKLEKAPNIEYRKILDAEQIISLMSAAQYKAAAQIFALGNRQAHKGAPYRLLLFCHYRMERMWQEAQNLGKTESYPEEIQKDLGGMKAYTQLKALGQYKGWIKEIFKKRSYFQLCENYLILDRHLINEDWTAVVLNMFRFIESYLYYALEEKLGYALIKNFHQEQKRLIKDAKTKFPEIAHRFGRKPIKGGVPLFIVAASQIKDQTSPIHGYFLKSFASLISILNPDFRRQSNLIPLDVLRHQIAHRGLGVSKQEFDSIPEVKSTLAAWGHWLKVPESNALREMEKLIKNLLYEGQ